MSRVDNFRKVPVKIPYKSGFDKSYRHTLTGTTGTLVPIFCDEVLPNQDSYLRIPFVLRMPPLATDTFMNVDYKMEAFFVPTRLLMAGNSYENFMTGHTDIKYDDGNGGTITNKIRTPIISLSAGDVTYGSLADYLGIKSNPLAGFIYNVSAFPFLAYHLIWEHWYRNSLIQHSIFSDVVSSAFADSPSNFNSVVPSDNASVGYSFTFSNSAGFADGSDIYELRQRNFGADYFTVATPKPQNGPSIGVALAVNTNVAGVTYLDNNTLGVHVQSDRDPQYWQRGSNVNIDTNLGSSGITQNSDTFAPSTGFTIASLRLANSLECFLERNNISGNRFVDFLKANYGADLKDGVAQRPVYLGSASFPVYTSGVMANGEPDPNGNTNNPFNSVASQYGSAHAEGSDFVVKFHSDEPGYLMVIGSLVPDITYGSGVDRMFMRYVKPDSRTDMANHLLQNVGPQPIFHSEAIKIVDQTAASSVFGYVDRYADWMTKNNKLSGELHDGESLQAFALQRNFNTAVISSQFLQIPTTFLDQVMAVAVANSNFTYWIDCYFEYKVSMPLARYSIPSLQDPAYEHGDTVWLNRGGVRID